MRSVLPLLVVLATIGCKKEVAQPTSTFGTDDDPTSGELDIDILQPEAGAHLPVGTVTVEGTQTGLNSVTLNGEPIEATSGTFSRDIELERGVNNIDARGEKGTTFRLTRRAVLAGTFAEPFGPIDEAMGIRLNQGGLDALGPIVGGLLDPASLTKSLSKSGALYESFVVDIYIQSIDFAPLDMAFEPSQGSMAMDLVLPDLEVILFMDTAIDFELEVTADQAIIGGDMGLGTDGQGHLTADFANPTVALDGFDYDTSLIPGDWSFLEGEIQGIVEGVLQDQIAELVPGLLEETLATLDIALELDLLGTPVSVGTSFANAFVDADGVQLIADLDVEVPGAGTKIAPGYLTGDTDRPTPNTVDDMTMSLSDDLVNRLLFELWNGGLIDMTLSTEDGSLPAAYLEAFGASSGTLALDAKLPPVLVQKEAATELQVGEVLARLETPNNPNFSYIDLALTAKLPVDLEVVDGSLTIAISDPDVQFVVRDTDWNLDHSAITQLLEEELPIETLIAAFGVLQFELPEIAGISLTNAAINRDASGVFTNIAADL